MRKCSFLAHTTSVKFWILRDRYGMLRTVVHIQDPVISVRVSPLADPRGWRQGRVPPRGPNSFISMQFLAKFEK